MEDGKKVEGLEKKDEGSAKKVKYVPPELVSLDKGEGAEGGLPCNSGSSAPQGGCTAGGAAEGTCSTGGTPDTR